MEEAIRWKEESEEEEERRLGLMATFYSIGETLSKQKCVKKKLTNFFYMTFLDNK